MQHSALQHRTVGDLMTDKVVRVQRGTTFKEIVAVLQEFDITAVPVVDDADRPLGVVSEADLLRRASGSASRAALLAADPAAVQQDTADALTAEGLMSAPAVCARPDWTVVEAVQTLEEHGVKRLPVVDEDGRLAGVVSRGDLLRIFLRPDRSIRSEIIEDVVVRTLGLPASSLGVEVADGRVVLSGTVPHRGVLPVLERLSRSVDGVIDVELRIEAAGDDGDGTPDD